MKSTLNILFLLCIIVMQTRCTKDNFFGEPPDFPVIDSLSPAAGFKGTQVRIWGTGFSTYTSRNIVRINGVLLRVDSPSTSTALLATLIDSTGTGPVELSLNNQEVKGPVFTYLGSGVTNDAAVITGGYFAWDGEPRYYSLLVKKVPATNNGIRVLVGGKNIPIWAVLRPGDDKYDNSKGFEILMDREDFVKSHADGIFANFMVTYNGIPSNTYPLQINPEIHNMFSAHGNYQFAAGDTLTITGNYFGNQILLPSSIVITYQGKTLKSPGILSWNNMQIIAVMPKYPEVPAGRGYSVHLDIKVGNNINRENLSINYLATDSIPPSNDYSKIEYSGTDALSEARKNLAAAGTMNVTIFAGGISNGPNGQAYSNTVDLYNVVNDTWSTARLSEARYNLAGAAAGNKIVFAGGYGAAGYSKTVDIYNTESGEWTVAKLSEARSNLAAVGAGNKIIFAGGETNRGTTGSSNMVDIYDVTTDSWTTALLTEPRIGLAAAAAGHKVMFAGGHDAANGLDSKTVDVFDITTNKWSATQLSRARYQLSGSGAGNKMVFSAGITAITGTAIDVVDVYDIISNKWSVYHLSGTGYGVSSAGRGNKIVIASGNTFDVYDVSDNSWITGRWSEDKFQPTGASAGNKILFGGGETKTGNGISSNVEIFTLSN